MARARRTPQRGGAGRVVDVRFVEVEFEAPVGTCLIIELEGGVRLLVADEAAIPLAGDLLDYLQRLREGGAR